MNPLLLPLALAAVNEDTIDMVALAPIKKGQVHGPVLFLPLLGIVHPPPTCLPTCSPVHRLLQLSACLPTCLPACLPTCLPA